MKFVGLFLLTFCCLVLDVQSFLWNSGGSFATRYPTNPPTTTPVPCVYQRWGKCSVGSNSVRTRQPVTRTSSCRPQTERCSAGASLASGLVNSFVLVEPAVPENNNSVSRTKRQAPSWPPALKQRDILFLLDESGSLGQAPFNNVVKRIAAGMVSVLCGPIKIGPDNTRVAVTSFDRTIHDHIGFGDYTNNVTLVNAIRSISYTEGTSGRTCLLDALEHVRDVIIAPSSGGRPDDKNVKQEIFIITDGCGNCPRDRQAGAMQNLMQSLVINDIDVYVVAIRLGRGACQQKLAQLAKGGRCNHFFFVPHVNENDFIAGLEMNYCSQQWLYNPANVQACA
uniref:uncharacterized protein LOC104265479 n=1 Tax=Ciona intestinalis TaxID=7719 RepID=UPI00089DAB02|nr:uncharacterized protein LOC104265479 [Ciona intestinalis]|eukprot:XP_018673224.1 uncharacterized protein LOC104265479 [Ciona intestinalis]